MLLNKLVYMVWVFLVLILLDFVLSVLILIYVFYYDDYE